MNHTAHGNTLNNNDYNNYNDAYDEPIPPPPENLPNENVDPLDREHRTPILMHLRSVGKHLSDLHRQYTSLTRGQWSRRMQRYNTLYQKAKKAVPYSNDIGTSLRIRTTQKNAYSESQRLQGELERERQALYREKKNAKQELNALKHYCESIQRYLTAFEGIEEDVSDALRQIEAYDAQLAEHQMHMMYHFDIQFNKNDPRSLSTKWNEPSSRPAALPEFRLPPQPKQPLPRRVTQKNNKGR